LLPLPANGEAERGALDRETMPGPYELYLIRHAVAEERGEAWPDDAKRPLSDDGAARMRKAARGLARLGATFDVILTSPLVRTRQTAELVAAAYDARPPIVAIESLAPGGSFQAVVAELEKQSRRRRIALVGHEPGIGEAAARLAGSRHPLEFKKGAVCRIDVDTLPPTGPGCIRWFLTTKILRAVRRS
jgi:phosphohistidine phosphatase